MQFLQPNPRDSVSRRQFLASASAAGAMFALPALLSGQDKKDPTTPADSKARIESGIERGLEWLKENQAQDGSWGANGGAHRTAMTALAGMCFLMEGGNLKEARYAQQIKKAVDWFLDPRRQRQNGLLADTPPGNYMHGHGFATMFLACAYGEAEDQEQQRNLEQAVKKAVEFIAKAQTRRTHRFAEGREVEIGGWGYVSAAERDFDEGSVTITQLQALRAARNATIQVPKETIDKAVAYLEACTTSKGGIIYSYSSAGGRAVAGAERPPLTAAAVACSFSAGQYQGELAKKWIKFCKDNIPIAKGRVPHDEYQNYYMSQFVYVLGDARYGEMFPMEPKDSWLTWSKYREIMYPYLIAQQNKNGSWMAGHMGPVYPTSVNLAILQLEKGLLPIYQR
ncbi:MAG: hypothetical protein L0241_24255 [Planctomycetia bacterium]|nr:hypothetical protein [Planctomycetia bacterium]